MIVGCNEDYVTASHPTFVATPRGIERRGRVDKGKRSAPIGWTVKYGNVASYANNRFPNDGMKEAGLTVRTLFYVDGDPNETVAPDSRKKELDEDHWVSFVLDNKADPPLRWLCIDASAVDGVDYSAADTLRSLYGILKEENTRLR